MMDVRYKLMASPVGKIWIAWSDEGLVSVGFHKQDRGAQISDTWIQDKNAACEAETQLNAYFAGERRHFDLPLVLGGTEFQNNVWRQLVQIPFGATTTYGSIAHRIGNPKASRAVGAANGQNRIAIVIPCHRVIGHSGKLTGFAGGIDIKDKLLRFEHESIAPTLPGV